MKRNLLTLLIIFLSVICGSSKLSAQSSGTWGGIDWTLTDDGTLTIAPTVNEITKRKPYSETDPKELYQVGEWPAAVNDAISAVTGWPYDRSQVKKLIIEEGVTSIGSFAAQSFTNLTGEVVIPSTVTYIGQEAFQNSSMTKLTFASGGTGELCIAPGAFKVVNITELELPGDRPKVHIHSWAFNDCPNLTIVIIPANVSFGGQTHLEYCGMDAVYSGDSQVFKGCSKLKNIYFASQEVKDAFFNAQYNSSNMTSMGVTTEIAVAKVNSTFYETIDDAVDNWTDGTTLTLLANVTLSDVITLKSTEHHILDLGTFTMTAASGMNAIQIVAYGNGGSEKGALTITADGNNLGGINAGNKSVVYYSYSTTYTTNQDRPIIYVKGGTFKGGTSTTTSAGFYISGTDSRKCATLNISGGIFNCAINGNGKSKLLISGGTFNYSVRSNGDSTSLRLISGGTFKSLPSGTMDRTNTKYWIGSAMRTSDKGIYVNNAGYYVVGGPIIKDYTDVYKCSFIPVYNQNSPSTGESDPLRYSSANPTPLPGMKKGETTLNGYNPTLNPNPNQNGLYYTSIKVALDNNNSSSKTVNIHTGTLELTSSYTYEGTICLPKEDSQFTVVFPDGSAPNFKKGVTTSIDGASVVSSDVPDGNGNVVRVYSLQDVARVNDVHYKTFKTAFGQASDGNTVYIIVNNVTSQGFELNKNVTIDFNNFTYTATSAFTVTEGKTITLQNGTITSSAPYVISTSGNLTMQDMTITGTVEYLGGELFTNKSFKIAPKKEFDGIGAVQGQIGWSTISTPIAGAKFSEPEENEGIHDLYRFNEADELWEYYKDDGNSENGVASNPFDELELGRGYLYANSHDIIFKLGEGNLNTKEVVFPLSYTEGNSLAGFNMIGNPFTHTISESNLSTSASATLADGFYVVGANGSWTAKADGKIAPMESVLIQADRAANLTIAPSTPNNGSKRAARNESSYLTIKVASKTHSDVTHISFNEGMGLDKINHRNPDNPMIYIPVDGKNYAIAMMNQDVKEVPVYFNANRMAEYTISIEQKNCEFSSVVLVDKLTGVETNLLIEDYSFMARSFDNADRFIIRLSIEDNSDSESDNFAFISNGQMIIEDINGQGIVRIFDIMGRHISQYSVSGSASIATDGFATGMYIIQMSDDNGVKVQKIIID